MLHRAAGAKPSSKPMETSQLFGKNFKNRKMSGLDLSIAIFLAQGQANAAKGNKNTKLPEHLEYPATWY